MTLNGNRVDNKILHFHLKTIISIYSVASNFGFSSGAPSQQAGTGAAPPNYRYIKVVLPFVLEYMINYTISITNIVMK